MLADVICLFHTGHEQNERTNEEVITLAYALLLCHMDDNTICALQCRYSVDATSFGAQTFIGVGRSLGFVLKIIWNY